MRKRSNGTRMNADERGFKIRRFRKNDLGKIAEIFMIESSKKPYGRKLTKASAIKCLSECLKDDIYLVVDSKMIIGFVISNIVSSDKMKAYVSELWIKSNYQKKGAGKFLIEYIEKKYKKSGVQMLRLACKKKSGAYGFYKKLKYVESSDLVFMDKII